MTERCCDDVISWAGRPFAMEMLNPHRYRFTKTEMKQIQEVHTHSLSLALALSLSLSLPNVAPVTLQTINTSSDKIAVRDLQIVTR